MQARKNEKAFMISIIAIALTLAGVIWAGSEKATKAELAYEFIDENKTLPLQVEQNTKEIDKLEIVPVQISRLEGKIDQLVKDIGTLDRMINRMVTR